MIREGGREMGGGRVDKGDRRGKVVIRRRDDKGRGDISTHL